MIIRTPLLLGYILMAMRIEHIRLSDMLLGGAEGWPALSGFSFVR